MDNYFYGRSKKLQFPNSKIKMIWSSPYAPNHSQILYKCPPNVHHFLYEKKRHNFWLKKMAKKWLQILKSTITKLKGNITAIIGGTMVYHRWLLQKDKLEIITKIKIIARFGAKMLGATKNFFGKYFFRRIIPNWNLNTEIF